VQEILEKYLKGDKGIWAVVILLSLFSAVMALSASSNMAYRLADGNATPFWIKHVFFLIIGIVIMVYLQHFKFKYFSRLSQVGLWLVIPLLLVTLAFGKNINSAQRWIMGFQPSDLAKVVLIIYVARMLALNKDKITNFKEGLLPILIPIAAICGLILPANFSTAFMLAAVCFTMLFVGGALIKHLLAVVGGAIGVFALLILLSNVIPGFLPRAKTWEKRVTSFITSTQADIDDPESKNDNYQAHKAKMAVGSAGIIGKRIGRGNVKNDLYSAQSDFIFSAVVEELGWLLGAIPLLVLYLIFFFRSLRIMTKSESLFGSHLVFGLSFLLIIQALINMAVGVNLIPVTGQPLPLISMGGTSILFICIAIGIILNVSQHLHEGDETSQLKTANSAS
jgi:cell division protein FtsW